MDFLINYKDFNINQMCLYQDRNVFNFTYNDNYFFLRTCFLTISKVGKENNKYYVDVLLNDINNSQTEVFNQKILEIDNLIKNKTGKSILYSKNNINKIRLYLNQEHNIIKTKVYYNGEYITNDILSELKEGNRISSVIFMDNINYIPYIEIIEAYIKPMHIPSEKIILQKLTSSNIQYYQIDEELRELNNLLNQ
jgi:hypothetical protein